MIHEGGNSTSQHSGKRCEATPLGLQTFRRERTLWQRGKAERPSYSQQIPTVKEMFLESAAVEGVSLSLQYLPQKPETG